MSNEVETSLVETLRSSGLYDLTFDVADAMLSPIPIFGSLSKLWGGVQSIHSYFYVKKVLAFLLELSSIPKEEREAQMNKMLGHPGEQQKFGEHLVLLLDRMNEVNKATMMGRVARAFIEEKLSLDDMKSLNFALDAIDLRMTGTLKAASDAWQGSTTHEAFMLAQCGLMTPTLAITTTPLEFKTVGLDSGPTRSERYETFKSARIEYTINRLGRLFIEVCLT
jgi:hypothetical protein